MTTGMPVLRARDFVGADAELAHLLLNILPVHADFFRRLADVAAVPAKSLNEKIALERFDQLRLGIAERQPRLRLRRHRRRHPVVHRAEQIANGDLRAGGEQQRLLDRRAQLADVAFPVMADARTQCIGGERLELAAETLRRLAKEMVDEQRDVLAPLRERRDDSSTTRRR